MPCYVVLAVSHPQQDTRCELLSLSAPALAHIASNTVYSTISLSRSMNSR